FTLTIRSPQKRPEASASGPSRFIKLSSCPFLLALLQQCALRSFHSLPLKLLPPSRGQAVLFRTDAQVRGRCRSFRFPLRQSSVPLWHGPSRHVCPSHGY